MREQQFIDNRRMEFGGNMYPRRTVIAGLTPEDESYDEEMISEYETNNGVPYIVDKLGIKDHYRIDDKVSTKAKAVDRCLMKMTKDEGMRDSPVGYETMLERFTSRLPEALERMVLGKKGLEVLDMLFGEVALLNNKSSKSFLDKQSKDLRKQKINFHKLELKKLLTTI